MPIVQDIQLDYELGHGKVKYILKFIDKTGYHCFFFIALNKYTNKYEINVHDRENHLNEAEDKFDRLQDAIKFLHDYMKQEIKLKHLV